MESDNASVVERIAAEVEAKTSAPEAPAVKSSALEVRVANLEAIVAQLAGHL